MATPKTRRRGTELEEAILHAAADELAEAGYPGLTMERVAQRAGTNKNAIYRRWPNRAALGVAAYRRLAADTLEPPDTGNLRDDALALLRAINCGQTSPAARVLRGLLTGVGEEPELREQLHQHAAEGGTKPWLEIVGRAVSRGEVHPGARHPRVATVALVLLRNEFLTRGLTTVDDDVLVEIVDEVYLPLIGA
ncbi:TetR/AcrR family transcriptional regulator [Amycolatopsis sp. CA-128772]|uniref:TetR/AcrR family transcriptional regulator n=1 Tax=Amycolatopsis sp. CA-128772 TaxID=2073159 RepID=UPI000CD02F75|nr:TetR/AcrR family transcriptional regulator [Amycolatopsis sp. CA-128772]